MLDSITRLARAYNTVERAQDAPCPAGSIRRRCRSRRPFLVGAHDRSTTRRRIVEHHRDGAGGDGLRMDEVIFEEFKGTGNSEVSSIARWPIGVSIRRLILPPVARVVRKSWYRPDQLEKVHLFAAACTNFPRRRVWSGSSSALPPPQTTIRCWMGSDVEARDALRSGFRVSSVTERGALTTRPTTGHRVAHRAEFSVRCECGKVYNTDDTHVGKRLECTGGARCTLCDRRRSMPRLTCTTPNPTRSVGIATRQRRDVIVLVQSGGAVGWWTASAVAWCLAWCVGLAGWRGVAMSTLAANPCSDGRHVCAGDGAPLYA